MNLREGTRRLALLLGVVGAIFGGFASYAELQTVLSQRARHNRFEQLAKSDVVKQEHKCRLLGYASGCSQITLPPDLTPDQAMPDLASQWKAFTPEQRDEALGRMTDSQKLQLATLLGYKGDQPTPPPAAASTPTASPDLTPDQAIQTLRGLPEDRQRAILAKLSPDVKRGIMAKLKTDTPPPQSFVADTAAAAAPKYTIENADGTPLASEINKGGISTIHWAKDYSVESIESEPNLYLYPTPAPSAWMYLLIALFPILGYFIPWGAVRAIGWVGTGFVAGPK